MCCIYLFLYSNYSRIFVPTKKLFLIRSENKWGEVKQSVRRAFAS